MMMKNLSESERTFVEEVGVVFEQTGMPRMAGRVFGWLLISDPPYQSPAELAQVLQASKGSISTTVRLLLQMGLTERHIIPGERHDHFKISRDALTGIIRHGIEEEIKLFRGLAEHGLKLIGKDESHRRFWLEEMHGRYSYLEKSFPKLMDRYEKRQEKKQLRKLLKNVRS
jgi:DNA-binding transcriptional regulator GbsR (MarR family)